MYVYIYKQLYIPKGKKNKNRLIDFVIRKNIEK
jgi:hypothetical protein